MSTILMIDDDKDFGGLVAAHFSGQGYTVVLAQSGAEGLAKAASVPKPEIIFLDIKMPDMNGIEVLRELEAGDETSEIPVLIVSGKYFDQGMQDLFSQERNFRAFLSKPVALSILQQKAEALLKK
ncbi:MAG TPA: response regulator [Elusimicrobiales bacterium]|nr:response regulator [Elusimicrobiales bacterium]